MATIAPPAAAVRAAPYNAIETMTYAATLPGWPSRTASFQPSWLPNAKNRAAGKTSVKMIVRRLRSIRLSSMPRTVRLNPPNGGTLRVVGSKAVVLIGRPPSCRHRRRGRSG